ncbi:hypothetical protein Pelo_17468 [Pelomyxa schiedti]|nr:hypothetical protein Pelo_17468 [Pelomyxa schiedti]
MIRVASSQYPVGRHWAMHQIINAPSQEVQASPAVPPPLQARPPSATPAASPMTAPKTPASSSSSLRCITHESRRKIVGGAAAPPPEGTGTAPYTSPAFEPAPASAHITLPRRRGGSTGAACTPPRPAAAPAASPAQVAWSPALPPAYDDTPTTVGTTTHDGFVGCVLVQGKGTG